jgi:peptide/nickel transport system permease protein
MLRYVFIRILLIIPVFFVLSTAVYLISTLTPGDKVGQYLEIYGVNYSGSDQISDEDYVKTARKLNLDKPHFYFSIIPRYYPDTLHRIVLPMRHRLATAILNESGSWKLTSSLLNETDKLQKLAVTSDQMVFREEIDSCNEKMMVSSTLNEFERNILNLGSIGSRDSLIQVIEITDNISNLLENRNKNYLSKRSYLPKLIWNGVDNRFHSWFGNVLKSDFGVSMIDGRKVFDKLKDAFPVTLGYVVMAYFFSFILAIPFGIISAFNAKSKFVKVIETLLSAVYSVPIFWLSTLAVIFLTTDEVSSFLNIFPSIGIGFTEPDATVTDRIITALPHFILPALIVALYSGAYLSLLIKRNIEKEMSESYFISLIARGISRRNATFRHAFPNSILALVTIIVMGFPAALAGSVVIEVIFNIPGMGRLLYDSLLRFDWNVVFAVVVFIGLLTYLFYMAGDLIYSFLNPKIKYQ